MSMTEKMRNRRKITHEEHKKLIAQLKEGKRYLMIEYKMHIKPHSRVPDHCFSFALSDPLNTRLHTEPCFNKECDHVHDMYCEHCEQIKRALVEIQTKVLVTDFGTRQTSDENR